LFGTARELADGFGGERFIDKKLNIRADYK
jgi:hypothetical protein